MQMTRKARRSLRPYCVIWRTTSRRDGALPIFAQRFASDLIFQLSFPHEADDLLFGESLLRVQSPDYMIGL